MWIFAIDAGTLTWEILAEIRRNEQHYLPDLSKQTARSLEGKNPRAGVSAGSMAGGTTDSNRGIILMELVYKKGDKGCDSRSAEKLYCKDVDI